jgi:hypothetical protein
VVEFADGLRVTTAQAGLGGSCRVSLVGAGLFVSVAAIIAVACDAEGRREIVGLHIGPSEAEPFWAAFLRGVCGRPLRRKDDLTFGAAVGCGHVSGLSVRCS